MRWPWQRTKLAIAHVWHLFGIEPQLPASTSEYDLSKYLDDATKEADKDEVYNLARLRAKKNEW